MIRPKLGVNVDHVATVRQARGERYPDPVHAAVLAESAGADQITVHLRQDRRHIQDRDVRVLRETVGTRLNLEMGATDEMLEIATDIQPDMVTLVPERREERTTEGGLDAAGRADELAPVIESLQDAGCWVSLFIDPSAVQIRAAAESQAELIELHTGDFCDATAKFHNRTDDQTSRQDEYERLTEAATLADDYDLHVAAGHGLNLENIAPVAAIPEIEEFNIGHSIVSRSVFVGFEEAVREMKEAMLEAREHGFDHV
jgi:pyridoxine 5-phosphate synthase